MWLSLLLQMDGSGDSPLPTYPTLPPQSPPEVPLQLADSTAPPLPSHVTHTTPTYVALSSVYVGGRRYSVGTVGVLGGAVGVLQQTLCNARIITCETDSERNSRYIQDGRV